MIRFRDAVRHIEQLVEKELASWPSEWQRFIYPGYVYEHTLRVRNLAVSIAQQEGADEQITELAALLHELENLKANLTRRLAPDVRKPFFPV